MYTYCQLFQNALFVLLQQRSAFSYHTWCIIRAPLW